MQRYTFTLRLEVRQVRQTEQPIEMTAAPWIEAPFPEVMPQVRYDADCLELASARTGSPSVLFQSGGEVG